MLDKVQKLNYPIPVIMDGVWVNSLGVVRSLAELGLKSLVLNSSSKGVSLASRYAIGMICPDPAQQPQELVEFLVELGRHLPEKSVFLVTDDVYLQAIDAGRAELEPYFYFPVPEYRMLVQIMDKTFQYRVARECGIPYPRTIHLESEADLAGWPVEAFPAVVKGRAAKGFSRASGRQVIQVNSQEDLTRVYQDFGQYQLVIQEYLPGDDDHLYTLGSYISPKGQALGIFTGRKLRQTPPSFGTCALGESLDCPQVAEQGLRLLSALGFYGISQVEFKLDPRDGLYKLIEVNARFWKWHSLATYCGVNLAAIAYLDLIGRNSTPAVSQRYGVRWTCLAEELKELLRGRMSFKEVVGGCKPPFVDGLLDLRDPLPSFKYVVDWVAEKVSKK